jgi:hypothetical protein
MATMLEESCGIRETKVIQGEGMVTPVSPMIATYDGREVRLIPGRHRLDPDCELVQKQPERFELCMPKDDRTTAPMRFRTALQVAERAIQKDLDRARASGAGEDDAGWRLS